MTTKTRGWCFTLNNYTVEETTTLQTPNEAVAYICFGKEIAPETGTPHLQGYLFLVNPRGMSGVKKIVGDRAHLEPAKGSPDQNVKYCSKEGDFWSSGEVPKQGKRTDLSKVRDQVLKEGVTMLEIAENTTSYQSLRFAEGLQKYKRAPPQREKDVRWYFGPTGTGKSRLAFEEAGDDVWISNRDGKWYDGYWGQKVAIFDDLRGDFCPFHTLLRLTDRYPYRVEVKGGSVWFNPETIIITSTYPPNQCYNVPESIAQLFRRIKVLKEFSPNGIITHKQPTINGIPQTLTQNLPTQTFRSEGPSVASYLS